MAFILFCAAGVRVVKFTLQPFVQSELCQSRNRIRCRRVLTGVDVTNLCLSAQTKGPSMSFKQARRAALGAGVLVWMLSAPVLAQKQLPMTIAFTNANVIPLDQESVEPDRTVLVRGDRIAEVGSGSEIKVPSDAVVIDCTGRYLVR